MSEIKTIFGSYAQAIGQAESQNIRLISMLKQTILIIEQNALDLNLNVYERATLKSVQVKLKDIEDEFRDRKTKKVLQPTWTERFSRGDQGRDRRYSSANASGSSRKANAEQS